MVRAAASAALPFRSLPVEAAVADVLAIFEVSVAVTRTRDKRQAELIRDDLRDLRVEPLAHLGAAVIDEHRAVLVHVHQRAGLIQERHVERDAELHRRERNAALEHRTGCVERGDRVAARAIVAGVEQFIGQRRDDVVFDALSVRRRVAFADAVVVGEPHVERIAFQLTRDAVEHHFHHQRALRAAEAAKRGVRLRVGLAAQRDDIDVGQVVRVVEVADGARRDGTRQIRRIARAQRDFDARAENAAAVVEARFVFVDRVVALAGDHEIVVAIGAQFDRPAQQFRRQRRDAREQRRLRFLAAKAAAHPPAFAHDVMRRPVEHMRDDLLHFARMLRRTVDEHAVHFLRHGVGDLAFEIELFLAADFERAADLMRRGGDLRVGVAALQMQRRQHELLCRLSLRRA